MYKKLIFTILLIALVSSADTQLPPKNCQAATWSSSVTYADGDFVVKDGGSYIHCGTCTGVPDPINGQSCWPLLGSCNLQATCTNPVNWVANKQYYKDDLVTYNGKIFRATQHHRNNVYPQRTADLEPKGTDNWTYVDTCLSPCEIPWEKLSYHRKDWEVIHKGSIYKALYYVQDGVEPDSPLAKYSWVKTSKTCDVAPPPSNCYPGDAPDFVAGKKYEMGDRVIHKRALWVNCGECSDAPGHGTDSSLINSCWVFLGSCMGPRTCATAEDWNPTIQYYMGDQVKYAGRLFRAYDHHVGSNPQRTNTNWVRENDCGTQCDQVYDNNFYYAQGWTTNYQGKIYQAKWWIKPKEDLPGIHIGWTKIAVCPGTVDDEAGTGCDAPAYKNTQVYDGGDEVVHLGRAWTHKDWGTTKGQAPGVNIWGVWELTTWCGAEPDCCGTVALWSGTKHYWLGECTKQGQLRYRAVENNVCHDPRWNPQSWQKVTCP